jgi:hypothetical protein
VATKELARKRRLTLRGCVVVTIMSGGCVSEARERERESEDEGLRERGVGSSKGEMGEGCSAGRRGGGLGVAGRASVGKRVASASTLFHPPTTLPLLLGPRGAEEEEEEVDEEEEVEEEEEKGGRGGQEVDRGWRAGGKRELGGTDEGRGVVARLSAR